MVLAESICQFEFSVSVSDQNQNSGFGRTLPETSSAVPNSSNGSKTKQRSTIRRNYQGSKRPKSSTGVKESKFQCTKSTSVFPMVVSFIFGVQRVHFSAVVLLLPFFQKPSSFLVFSVSCSHVKDRAVGFQGLQGGSLAEKVENSVWDYPCMYYVSRRTGLGGFKTWHDVQYYCIYADICMQQVGRSEKVEKYAST